MNFKKFLPEIFLIFLTILIIGVTLAGTDTFPFQDHIVKRTIIFPTHRGPRNTVAPSVSGSTNLGSVLTCAHGTWTSNAGSVSYSYSWQYATTSIGVWSVTPGANSSTYSTVVGDVNNYLRCNVKAKNKQGFTLKQTIAIGPIAGMVGNEFISTVANGGSDAGANCHRFSSLVSDPGPSGDCATFTKACALASGGDTISVESGIFPVQIMTRASGCSPSSQITFVGQGEASTVIGTGGGSAFAMTMGNSGIFNDNAVAPDFITFTQMGFNGSVGAITQSEFEGGSPLQSGFTGIMVHDLVLDNVHVWDTGTNAGSATGGSPLVALGDDSYNITIKNSDIGPGCCNEDLFSSGSQCALDGSSMCSIQLPFPTNWIIKNNNIHDDYASCLDMPASEYTAYGCSGSGFSDPGRRSTTLTANMGTTGTTISVASGFQYITNPTGFFYAQIGTEKLQVVGNATGTTWTVQRGSFCTDPFSNGNCSTSGSSHSSGDTVTLINANGLYDHIDAMQWYDESPPFNIIGNRFYNAGDQEIFLQPAGGGGSQILSGGVIADNYFWDSNGCGSCKAITFGGPCTAACYQGDFKFLYNTVGSGSVSFGSANGSFSGWQLFAPGTTMEFVGDLFNTGSGYGFATGTPGSGGTYGGCQLGHADGSLWSPTFSYNVVPSGACGSDNIETPTFVSTSPTAPNLDLSPKTQTGITHAGENGFCGPGTSILTDINGTLRPGTPCTIGANEPV